MVQPSKSPFVYTLRTPEEYVDVIENLASAAVGKDKEHAKWARNNLAMLRRAYRNAYPESAYHRFLFVMTIHIETGNVMEPCLYDRNGHITDVMEEHLAEIMEGNEMTRHEVLTTYAFTIL